MANPVMLKSLSSFCDCLHPSTGMEMKVGLRLREFALSARGSQIKGSHKLGLIFLTLTVALSLSLCVVLKSAKLMNEYFCLKTRFLTKQSTRVGA